MPRRQPLTIKSDGRDNGVDADAFFVAARNMLQGLRRVAKNMAPNGTPPRWKIVNATKTNPVVLELEPVTADDEELAIAEKATRAFVSGVNRRKLFPRETPEFFDATVLRFLDRATRVADASLSQLTVALNGSAATLGYSIESPARVVEALEDKSGIVWTSIEGRLTIIDASSSHPQLTIEREGDGLKIGCRFEGSIDDPMFKEAKTLLPHRVSVFGRVSADKTGKPRTILINRLLALPEERELPSFKDMPRADITGGVDSVEHVEKLRGDDDE